jgi:hypothetical protein
MIDRIFSAALTFCLLIAGTLAVGSALFGQDTPHRPRPDAGDRAAHRHGDRPTHCNAVDASAIKVAATVQDTTTAPHERRRPAPAAEPAALAHI